MSVDDDEYDDVFDFYEQLKNAKRWEAVLEPVLGNLVWREAERIDYADDPEMQVNGIDHVLSKREFEEDGLEVKVITQNYDNIFYETRHETVDGEQEWDGWVYKYDDRVILWCWLSDNNTRIIDARWLLIDDGFRLWFKGPKNRIPEIRSDKPTKKDGRVYWSYGVPVPLDEIPSAFIRPADAAVGLKIDTEQTELENFGMGGSDGA